VADLPPKFLSDKQAAAWNQNEQSYDADRVVCNDAGVFLPRWWSLQRRRIAVYHQLDDSAASPGAMGADPQ